MYAFRIACCPLASHVDSAPRALLRLEKNTPRALLRLDKNMEQTDGRQTVTLRLPLDASRVMTKRCLQGKKQLIGDDTVCILDS